MERGSSLFSFQLKTLTQINASFHHYIDLTFRISDKLGFNRKRIPVHIMLYFLLRFGALPIHNSYDLRTLENLNILVTFAQIDAKLTTLNTQRSQGKVAKN